MFKRISRRLFLKRSTTIAAAGTILGACRSTDRPFREDHASTELGLTGGNSVASYDYIVIGSGAGGGPLACNLAKAGYQVLLLEAGDDQSATLTYQVPALNAQEAEEPDASWRFFVKHYTDPNRQKQDEKYSAQDGGIFYPRAGTVGGCTAHNALITVYPHASDWDHVANLTGDKSWLAKNMRPYFVRLERCTYLSGEALKGHGLKGWLATKTSNPLLIAADRVIVASIFSAALVFNKAMRSSIFFLRIFADFTLLLGVIIKDLNADTVSRDGTVGLFNVPLAVNGNKRAGTRDVIASTLQSHPNNLFLTTGALVSRITFDYASTADGRRDTSKPIRASGVEYLAGKHLYAADPKAHGAQGSKVLVKAKREVIVSGGTFNTPQILHLSGVGPAAELNRKDLNIPVLVDLPGVGRNLQDRYEVGVISKTSENLASLSNCTFGAAGDPCIKPWRQGKDTIYGNSGPVLAVIRKSSVAESDPDLFLFLLPAAFKGYYPGFSKVITADHRHLTWAILKGHTRNNAGTVTLRSTSPRDVPEINFRYFDEGVRGGADDKDLQAVVEAVKFARQLNADTKVFAFPTRIEEVLPGPQVASDEQIRTFIKNNAWGHHACGTCKIGADGDHLAVLNSKFQVRDPSAAAPNRVIEGLRVVDASVFPKIPGFFIVTSVYMISEKASDDILKDAKVVAKAPGLLHRLIGRLRSHPVLNSQNPAVFSSR